MKRAPGRRRGRVDRIGVVGEQRQRGVAGDGRRQLRLSGPVTELHVNMLNDDARTSAFLMALRKAIRPGDVVLDIGTGTGVFAVAAVQAGARHVYAMEAGAILPAARRVIEVNGVGDQVTLLHGWSGDLRLPERADVLVAELIGDEPFAEGIVGIVRDAVRRMLRPGARLVPARVRVLALPLQIPPSEAARLSFTNEALSAWHARYGIDFSPLAEMTTGPHFAHAIDPLRVHGWRAIARPIPVMDVRLAARGPVRTRRRVVAEAATDGTLNAVVLAFELHDAAGPFYSTEPSKLTDGHHWQSPLCVLHEPLTLEPGDRFVVDYAYHPRLGRSSCRVRRLT
jgi:hypothetical protein